MLLKQLRLHDFRSYRQLSLTPPEGVTAIVGENGAGKTNLLEAVHLCCLGKSHRTSDDRDMVREGTETCAVHAKVLRIVGEDEVGVRIFARQRANKVVYVNGKTAPRIGEMMGHINCVMFSPEDLDIIKGGPMNRRRYLDMLLSQSDPAYFYALQHYQTVLKQRNALLRAILKGAAAPDQLDVWDEQLASYAVPLVRLRRRAAVELDTFGSRRYAYISDREDEKMSLRLNSQLGQRDDISGGMFDLLQRTHDEDIRRQTTTIGPHRDDLDFRLSGRDMKAYASQGQIRTAVLALRLAEMDIVSRMRSDTPLLLLDDVLSELDALRRTRLISCIKDVQTLITCTELEDLSGARVDGVLTVRDGMVK